MLFEHGPQKSFLGFFSTPDAGQYQTNASAVAHEDSGEESSCDAERRAEVKRDFAQKLPDHVAHREGR